MIKYYKSYLSFDPVEFPEALPLDGLGGVKVEQDNVYVFWADDEDPAKTDAFEQITQAEYEAV